jgi:hypothetical protein
MNIFKALSEGNGRISETNITSFLNYLLDNSNELNNSFFVLFMELIDSQLSENKLCDLLEINQKNIREKIRNFSTKYIVNSEPEYSITNNKGTRQVPDILTRISSKSTEEDIAFLIIENKISKNAITKGQVEKQYDFFTKSEDYIDGIPVYSILITPDEKVFEKTYKPAIDKNIRTLWLKWVNHTESEWSIEAISRILIKNEQNAEIQPIDPNTQFIIKSFIDYLATEFSLKEIGKKNTSYLGFDLIGSIEVEVENKKFIIKRFSNNMIRLFDEDDNLLEIDVKPILRKINENYNLGIELFHSTGKAKNTQILGREIINKIKIN